MTSLQESSQAPAHNSLKGELALITGATAGIGLETARALAARGCDLILTGRRLERLQNFSRELKTQFGIDALALPFDLSSRDETSRALTACAEKLQRLSILVNNAGLAAGVEPVPTANIDDWDKMIDTNVKGLMTITRLCLPYLLKQKSAHIVNLGSVAGRWTYPGGAVYCASKFAVRAFSEGLRMDLIGSRVRVTNIEPGMVETEFSVVRLKDENKAKAVYQDMTPLQAKDIADTILWCLERPGHVNIQELVIFPTDQVGVGPNYVHRHRS